MTQIMEIKNLSKIFGPHPKKALKYTEQDMSKQEILEKTGHTVGVNNVSFEVKQGEMFVIMGLSGSGKSTLIRCLNLLNKLTAGQIMVDGEDVTTSNQKTLI